jgi:hypothetical protein
MQFIVTPFMARQTLSLDRQMPKTKGKALLQISISTNEIRLELRYKEK